ncbi:hypothetical protein AX14_005240 [Amanita brunnescens Koide BX004]|nr:hypothetical protein AX14_005240 [Amanita brunnescens Koide BX004]
MVNTVSFLERLARAQNKEQRRRELMGSYVFQIKSHQWVSAPCCSLMAMSIAYECVPLHYKPLIFLQLQCASYAIRDVSFHLQSINIDKRHTSTESMDRLKMLLIAPARSYTSIKESEAFVIGQMLWLCYHEDSIKPHRPWFAVVVKEM